jgi:hypothetical protein
MVRSYRCELRSRRIDWRTLSDKNKPAALSWAEGRSLSALLRCSSCSAACAKTIAGERTEIFAKGMNEDAECPEFQQRITSLAAYTCPGMRTPVSRLAACLRRRSGRRRLAYIGQPPCVVVEHSPVEPGRRAG